MSIATTLEKHAITVFQNLPNNNLIGIKLKFYEKLPAQFDRQGYLKVAAELGIQSKAAEKYISQFKPKLLRHEPNQYTKITIFDFFKPSWVFSFDAALNFLFPFPPFPISSIFC